MLVVFNWSTRKMFPKYPQLKFGLVLGIGALIALMLCVQCVRTYLYTDAVLVPQQAESEANREAGALGEPHGLPELPIHAASGR